MSTSQAKINVDAYHGVSLRRFIGLHFIIFCLELWFFVETQSLLLLSCLLTNAAEAVVAKGSLFLIHRILSFRIRNEARYELVRVFLF